MRYLVYMALFAAMVNPFCCCSAAVQAGVEAGKPLPLAPSCCSGDQGAEDSDKPSGTHGAEQCPHQTGSGLVTAADSLKLLLPIAWITAPVLVSELSWTEYDKAESSVLPTARWGSIRMPPPPPWRELKCSWLI